MDYCFYEILKRNFGLFLDKSNSANAIPLTLNKIDFNLLSLFFNLKFTPPANLPNILFFPDKRT